MGHHSYLEIGSARLFWTREWCHPDAAALFTESDRYFETGQDGDGNAYGYQTTARRMRERLQARGFTARRAWSGFTAALTKWAEDPDRSRAPGSGQEEFQRFLSQLEPDLNSPERIDEFTAAHDQPFAFLVHLDDRDVVRLLLDQVPDDSVVTLNLSELTGCCVEMDERQPIAASARREQLQRVAVDSPLIVLTEGKTDSRLLSDGMKVTHPHLSGFINFIDFEAVKAEPGAGMLPKIVYAFVASGVANRIVAIGDNDTAAHGALEKIKTSNLPDNVRILHYPDLSILQNYPTLGPSGPGVIPMDINGCAGAVEMYFGQDALTIDGELAPVQWTSLNPKVRRYQGALRDKDKKAVQQRFEQKVKRAHARGGPAPGEDWSGIEAIVDHLLIAFD
ncbi:HEPN/Toprim-associated domain-containing protein [Actinomadura madurae]|uniref:HEPN/Toprim-associated domain-containing protein n=1 Tax=Actinomadura madurae TaxID=1993 RepID=UPI0020D212B2|nr:HEPN/Toprim-associated domain-containing protein [Actinomadura madurae]MCP9952327.1 HEPN/Toprim-associated domain-containing protein [Actinomadura madurae]MCP9969096.1 HEPN/Toprim-associated domain-containing protein [Actinomadura madurae]MCP9981568.1 HEPN/Toprim-associated domain-containing protein [Actinomadura madurae]MCQ0006924.1 HEPN/Toprim-associated domain-containing protein [Actinomadura madurae]MCQ0017767.1 HEPN/Toprim-associated domain-containing protein [Actinomadura madurae]